MNFLLIFQFFVEEMKEQGQGLVEYGLILVLVSIAAVVIMSTLGAELTGVFNDIATTFSTATN